MFHPWVVAGPQALSVVCSLTASLEYRVYRALLTVPSQNQSFRKRVLTGALTVRNITPRKHALNHFRAPSKLPLGYRLMAGQRILVPSMGVRLPLSQPLWPVRLAV